jgi:hypothetical protein
MPPNFLFCILPVTYRDFLSVSLLTTFRTLLIGFDQRLQ